MLEDIKLSIFKNNFLGFAYEFGHKNNQYILQIYMVVGTPDNYSFVKFRKTTFIHKERMSSLIEVLNEHGYTHINHWIQSGNSDKKLAKRPITNYKKI